MKNLKYITLGIFLISTSVFAQNKNKQQKEEVEVKTTKIKDNEKTVENKVKTITIENSDVVLDKKDEFKTNQKRVESPSKVEKMVMIDNDADNAYDLITKDTYYKLGNKKYVFMPNKKGFDMAFDNNGDEFVKIGKAIHAHKSDHFIIKDKKRTGIGSFDADGNFMVQFYNESNDNVEVKTYYISEPKMK